MATRKPDITVRGRRVKHAEAYAEFKELNAVFGRRYPKKRPIHAQPPTISYGAIYTP